MSTNVLILAADDPDRADLEALCPVLFADEAHIMLPPDDPLLLARVWHAAGKSPSVNQARKVVGVAGQVPGGFHFIGKRGVSCVWHPRGLQSTDGCPPWLFVDPAGTYPSARLTWISA